MLLGVALSSALLRCGGVRERMLADRLEHRKPDDPVARLRAHETPADDAPRGRRGTSPGPARARGRPRAMRCRGIPRARRGAVRWLSRQPSDSSSRSRREGCAAAREGRPVPPSRVRVPPPSARMISAGGRTTSRAATSSMASGKAIESAADLVHRCKRVVAEDDTSGGCELDEERGSVVDREWFEREHVLCREPQRRSARREHLKVGGTVEQRCATCAAAPGRCSRLSR